MSQVKRFRADHRHVVETEFDDAQFVSVADYDSLQQRLNVAEQRNADNLKLISGLVEYADNLLADVNNAWSYAGSTGEPETHKDEDYAAALNLLSATVSSHE